MPHHGNLPAHPSRRKSARRTALIGAGLAAALAAGACGGTAGSGGSDGSGAGEPAGRMPTGPSCVKSESNRCLPLAPAGDRVDLTRPGFSDPTSVTNPLHPTGKIAQSLYSGHVDGKPFRSEVTLLPETRTIRWNGEKVKALTSQYVAFLDGRIQEVALDWYAQADDGSVWYFGEDVFNYEKGLVADHKGTWLAGKDGPPAMIMPANPRPGDVYRPENIPGKVFEEVRVKSVGQNVPGPQGRVNGAITVTETHMDGKLEDKVFAPGYGEFSTGSPKGDLEAMALTAPTDARPGPVPAGLNSVSDGADTAFDAAGQKDWAGAAAAARAVQRAWDGYRADQVPATLAQQLSSAVGSLTTAVADRDQHKSQQAALGVTRAGLDLELRHRPAAEIDRARLDLWARQLALDTTAKDRHAVAGDVASLDVTWDRVRHTADQATVSRIDSQLRELRGAADRHDLPAVADTVTALQASVAALR